MKPGTLLIRADATPAIGTGHVMRCLALAQAWQDRGGTAGLATAELPSGLRPRLTAEGLGIDLIEAAPNSLEDAEQTVAHARHRNAGGVVVDGDRFGSEFLERIRSAGISVTLIDDFAQRESYPVDLIVNPNLDEDEGAYRKHGARAPIRMGPAYILLRREFQHAAAEREVAPVGNRILVTLGGSDPDHLTNRIVAALAEGSGLEITAVAGAGFGRLAELEALRAKHVRVISNASNMAELMKESDLAIIAGGGTLWELLAMSCVVLSYSRNRIQREAVVALEERGIVLDLGDRCDFEPGKLVAEVQKLAAARKDRERMTSLGRRLVDGSGATRIVEAMLDLGIS